ncbi:unnamed protein product [Ascophyllum nodosum]
MTGMAEMEISPQEEMADPLGLPGSAGNVLTAWRLCEEVENKSRTNHELGWWWRYKRQNKNFHRR